MPTVVLPRGGEWPLVDLLVAGKLATGRNDAKRLIEGGSVQVDGEKVADARASVAVRDGMVLRGRRRQFARLAVGGAGVVRHARFSHRMHGMPHEGRTLSRRPSLLILKPRSRLRSIRSADLRQQDVDQPAPIEVPG